MSEIKFENGCSRYGADMGRRDLHSDGFSGKLQLQRVCLVDGDYDNGGAYWGAGRPLYVAQSANLEVRMFMRADSREDAKARIRARYPQARFFR